MVDQYHLSMPRVLNMDLADANLTGFASNVSGASWALTATAASDGLAHQVSVRNDSANNKSGINITFVGTDANGNAQTETIAGPAGSATVETTGYYLTLTSVTPAATWGADTADIGWVDEVATAIFNINVTAEDVLAINADVTGTISFTLQQTFDDIQSVSAIRWGTVPSAGAQTADGVWNTTGGATALRVLINSYSSGAELRLNLNATAISNSSGNGGGGGGGGGDVNLIEVGGAAIALGQGLMAASFPVTLASNQSALDVNIVSGGGAGGTSSNFSAAFPTAGTAAGMSDGANMVPFTTTDGTSLNVAVVSGGGSNASVSATGAAVPTDATYVGFRNAAGNLTAGQLMADGSLQATPITVRATPSDSISNSGVLARMQDTAGAFAYLGTIPIQYNGTTWDLPRGDATNGLLVNLGANNDVTISGTATVSGTVAATQSGTWNIGTVTTVTTVGAVTAITNALPAGTNNIGDVDVLSVVPGVAATNLGKAEDAAHASGDTGVAIWGVRRDTAATFGADGDYTPLRVDQYGDQIVQVADSTGLPLTYLPPGLAAASASNPVVSARSTALNNGQVAATATAGTLLAQNTNRMSVTFINFGANTVYIGEATVTAANGLPLIAGASYTSESSALFQVICDTGLTSTVAYIEEVA